MSRINIIKQVPINVLIKRVLKRLFPAKEINYTALDFRSTSSSYSLNSLLNSASLKTPIDNEVVSHYINHEFDLLGSGWVKRESKSEQVFCSAHQSQSKEILHFINSDYQLINWQLDVKSGYEFDVQRQFDNQVVDQSKNIDIKNCWELGRLQHFPQLAVAAVAADNKNELIEEFKNQCLDFIGSNPVGMGVQWACAMDVGIRVANMLLAYDILKQLDTKGVLDGEFVTLFTSSVEQHGVFIENHLEYKEGVAGNHYLFNLLGLLFVANYLSESALTAKWKSFAEKELEKEFYKQFFNDGGNFEGSTTYHCLSAEAMLYATTLMLRSGTQLSKKYTELLYKVALFIQDVMKPSGDFPQFGDNDSGRLFKWSNEDKNLLNYESLLVGFTDLFEGGFDEFGGDYSIYMHLVEQLSNKSNLTVDDLNESIVTYDKVNFNTAFSETTILDFSNTIDLAAIKNYSYPEFGIYVFKSSQFYMSISAIANKEMHHSWGHVHNDKLSFELQVNGVDLVGDPGTYTYSAFPDIRNELRSTKAHHGIVVDKVDEQNKFSKQFHSLTYMDREVKCNVLELSKFSIAIQANYYGVEHTRKFEIIEDKLIVTDYCNKPFKVNINQYDKYSPNYGVIEINSNSQ